MLLLAIWIGVGFIFRGVSVMASAISDRQFPGRGWAIFFGVISLIAGVVVLAYPFDSIVTLALVVGIWLIVLGVVVVISGFGMRTDVKKVEKATGTGAVGSGSDLTWIAAGAVFTALDRSRRHSCSAKSADMSPWGAPGSSGSRTDLKDPTTWHTHQPHGSLPAQTGGWKYSLWAATSTAANHSGTDGRPPPATAGRIGAHTEPRQTQMVCASPPRSRRPQTGAWRSSSSVTIFNPRAWDPVERFTRRRSPPATVGCPAGVHTRRAGRTSSGRRLLFAVPMATWSCLCWATTERCGTCGRQLPTTAGPSGSRMAHPPGFS